MSRVDDWFPSFCDALIDRSLRADWPAGGSGYWDDFRRELLLIGSRWEEADVAISRVCNQPKVFIADFRPLILAEIKKIQREPSAPSGVGLDPKAAEAASRDCVECRGTGMAIRFVHECILGRLKTANGSDVPVGASVAIPCDCAFGRHLARSGLEGGKVRSTIGEFPTLRRSPFPWANCPDGLDSRFRYRPRDWNDEAGRPWAYETDAIKAIPDLRALTSGMKPPKGPRIAQERSKQLSAISAMPKPADAVATPSRPREDASSHLAEPEDTHDYGSGDYPNSGGYY